MGWGGEEAGANENGNGRQLTQATDTRGTGPLPVVAATLVLGLHHTALEWVVLTL